MRKRHEGTKARRHEGEKTSTHSPPASASPRLRGFDLIRLRSDVKPLRLHWYSRLRSTNDHAASLRKRKKLFAPAIVLTSHQIAGRGRGKNSWWAGQGSLTVTFVLPVQEHTLPHQVPLIAGLAVRNALAAHTGIDDIQLKWPNDLLHRDRKLAGLLCERLDSVDLIGLGVNVNVDLTRVPQSLRNRVTSLSTIAGMAFDMTSILIDISKSLHSALSHRDETQFSQILKEYDRHHALVGRKISAIVNADEPPMTGICVGLDNIGRLLLKRGSALSRIIAAQVDLPK